ncbi:hypothetical protein ACOIPL_002914 [Vibrio fluvialis]
MIQEKFFYDTVKRLSELKLSPVPDATYQFKDTFKQQLLDPTSGLVINMSDTASFSLEMRADEYKNAIFSDYYFGHKRICEQIKNLKLQIENNSQVAWVLITAYYASFFMATELSRLYGIYSINLNQDNMHALMSLSSSTFSGVINEPNYGYKVCVSNSSYDGFVRLNFYKNSGKPHLEVWKNMTEIIKRIEVDDNILLFRTLFLNIVDKDNSRWHTPSNIRNEWNYTYSTYYGDRGTTMGASFYKNIRDIKSTMGWASNRTLAPHDENIVASLSFIYYCLYSTFDKINNRLGIV